MSLIAHAGAPPDPIPFSALPTTVPLDFTSSTPGAGSIVEYKSRIKSAPDGHGATISNTAAGAPTLQGIDKPGTYIVEVNVRDSVDGWAFDDAHPDRVPYSMPTALIHIVVETENLGLQKPALHEATMDDHPLFPLLDVGDEGYTSAWRKMDALFDAVDALAASATKKYVTRYAKPGAGPIDADGSEGNPFNATSAADGGFAGPAMQAWAALDGIAGNYDAGRTLVLYGGVYTEQFAPTARELYTIVPKAPYVAFSGHPFRLRICADADKRSAVVGFIIDGPGYLQPSSL